LFKFPNKKENRSTENAIVVFLLAHSLSPLLVFISPVFTAVLFLTLCIGTSGADVP